MKKVKAMLSGIAVIAIVAGFFAFKAKQAFSTTLEYTTTSVNGTYSCNLPATSTGVGHASIAVTSYFYTLGSTPAECSTHKTYISIPD